MLEEVFVKLRIRRERVEFDLRPRRRGGGQGAKGGQAARSRIFVENVEGTKEQSILTDPRVETLMLRIDVDSSSVLARLFSDESFERVGEGTRRSS